MEEKVSSSSDLVVRVVRVLRSRTSWEALAATSRHEYVDDEGGQGDAERRR